MYACHNVNVITIMGSNEGRKVSLALDTGSLFRTARRWEKVFQITLCALRESRGYTIEDVAKYCKIEPPEVKKYEDNPGDILSSIAIKLRKLYGIPIDYILI